MPLEFRNVTTISKEENPVDMLVVAKSVLRITT